MATLLRSTGTGMHRMLWLVFPSLTAREAAMRAIIARGGWNYFVCYDDTHGPTLNVGYADWAAPGIYVDW